MPSSLAEILICAGSFRRAAPRGADSVMSPQFTLSLSHQEGPRTGQERHNGAGGAPRGQDPIVCGLTRPGWCWWDSCGGLGRGRVQICCKGAPDRNINDSSPAPRRDRGLCNRFGQTAPPWTPRMGGTGRDDGPWTPPLTPRRALRTRTCSSNRHSRVQSAHLDEEGASRGRRGPRRRSRSGTSPATRWERLNERRAPPLPLCYALFSSLRLCTLCCTEKRSVAEGERAWRRERGVADGSARPREPRGR